MPAGAVYQGAGAGGAPVAVVLAAPPAVEPRSPKLPSSPRRGVSPRRNRAVAAIVAQAGAKLGMRVSHVPVIVELLEDHGFQTAESLANLTDEVAATLGVPRSLAAALREDAAPLPEFFKFGPVPVPPPAPPLTLQAPKPAGYPSYDVESPRRSGLKGLHDPAGGFPTSLRGYLPKPAPRLSCGSENMQTPSPADVSLSVITHLARQQCGREQREGELDSPFPGRYRSSSPIFSRSRNRPGILGAELPRHALELTADIALTTPCKAPGLDRRFLTPVRRRLSRAATGSVCIEARSRRTSFGSACISSVPRTPLSTDLEPEVDAVPSSSLSSRPSEAENLAPQIGSKGNLDSLDAKPESPQKGREAPKKKKQPLFCGGAAAEPFSTPTQSAQAFTTVGRVASVP